MKKIFKPYLFAALFIFCLNASVYASIDNNRFDITMVCLNSAGNYCDAQLFDNDEFIFGEDESDFEIDNMTSLGYGSYEDNGLFLEAEYIETIPFLYKYKFEISALNILDFMLFGTMKIVYGTEWNFLESEWNSTEEATALFFGFLD